MKNVTDPVSTQVAKLRRKAERNWILRILNGKTVATLTLGTALSIGGATDVLQNVHFMVRKDLDGVRIVKQEGKRSQVVARVSDGFAANSLFKLSRVFPESLVSHQISLFTDTWITGAPQKVAATTDVFHREMARINEAILREFFSSAIPFGNIIHEKSQKYDVDPALVAAVMETESRFRSNARSQVGAQGLMQLMPRTGRWMGANNLYDPEQNVDAGVKYISYLQRRFNGNMKQTIAAYNAGEGNVKRYGGIPPFAETQSYVQKVFNKYRQRSKELKAFDKQKSGGVAPAAEVTEGVVTVR